jgi:hypothetical protein
MSPLFLSRNIEDGHAPGWASLPPPRACMQRAAARVSIPCVVLGSRCGRTQRMRLPPTCMWPALAGRPGQRRFSVCDIHCGAWLAAMHDEQRGGPAVAGVRRGRVPGQRALRRGCHPRTLAGSCQRRCQQRLLSRRRRPSQLRRTYQYIQYIIYTVFVQA